MSRDDGVCQVVGQAMEGVINTGRSVKAACNGEHQQGVDVTFGVLVLSGE
jgi:hypothetical protein